MENLILLQKMDVIGSQPVESKYHGNDYIKFETENIKSSFCDYSHAFILVRKDITVTSNNNTDAVI